MTIPANWTGILLAAGRGRRFDPLGDEDKLRQILPGGSSIACRSAAQLQAVLPDLCVVVRPDNQQLIQQLQQSNYPVLICSEADEGMAASLTAALRHTKVSAGWIVALADMPFVQQTTIALVLQALQNGADIVVPVFGGRRGHPVGFSHHHLPELLGLTGDQGARMLLQKYPVLEVVVNDPGILQDIDNPADLQTYLPKI
ncbi:nucleotidyltransferase family protein [Undibacterium jejuense]|uniref:Nucleotidyltransferase family protein n=1 Tax=Undibacterium jejuense TaxID=1344949 RepID=A0A923KRR0_9BURK|nr:nucleotidyltransferase family protein [Undibacterium jejuense]MBC3864254.1 nucleotidyltransferase family protein [Undibacterium jejuense]